MYNKKEWYLLKRMSEYGKVIMMIVGAFVMITAVESTYIKQRMDSNMFPVNNRYETISDKTNQRTSAPTEKNAVRPVQKSTEKTTVKATQKSTEKTTVKATQKSTEKTTVKATDKSQNKSAKTTKQVPTEPPTTSDNTSADKTTVSENNSKNEFVIMTDPPTEWSQELQDKYNEQYDRGYLIAIDNPDYSYATGQVLLCEEDKKLACQIVMGEAGGESFEDCCVVAQCLKDSMVFLRYNSIKEVQKECRYDGFREEYSEKAQAAVEYIFDQNKSAIAHRVLFFYAADLCQSEWHETQYHVLTRRYARYFDMW